LVFFFLSFFAEGPVARATSEGGKKKRDSVLFAFALYFHCTVTDGLFVVIITIPIILLLYIIFFTRNAAARDTSAVLLLAPGHGHFRARFFFLTLKKTRAPLALTHFPRRPPFCRGDFFTSGCCFFYARDPLVRNCA